MRKRKPRVAPAFQESSGIDTELQKILNRRLDDEGWESIRHFLAGTSCPYSLETARRAFNSCDYKVIGVLPLATIMKCLNYSTPEIKDMLERYVPNAKHDPLMLFLSDLGRTAYDMYEESLVKAYRAIVKANPSLSEKLADVVDMIAQIARIDVKPYTNPLRRGQI